MATSRSSLPEALNELINRRKPFRNCRTRLRGGGTGHSATRTYALGVITSVRCVSVVIYLADDRQNIHVKIITRRLPMDRENETPRRGARSLPLAFFHPLARIAAIAVDRNRVHLSISHACARYFMRTRKRSDGERSKRNTGVNFTGTIKSRSLQTIPLFHPTCGSLYRRCGAHLGGARARACPLFRSAETARAAARDESILIPRLPPCGNCQS